MQETSIGRAGPWLRPLTIFATVTLATFSAVALAAAPAAAAAAGTERVSVSSGGTQGNAISQLFTPFNPSDDGRYVAYVSSATNLVAGDTNGVDDVFVRDRQAGTTERVSVSSGGTEGNAASNAPAISGDGRYVVFTSTASNLVAGDTNANTDVFLRDRQTGTTERVSLTNGGAEANGASFNSTISDDGNRVAFASGATNLVSGDANGVQDAFVRDRQAGTTVRISVSTAGTEANNISQVPVISGDGSSVAFASLATNLVSGDTNGARDIFLRDLQAATTERVSLTTSGGESNGAAGVFGSISDDGRYVAFDSVATNLVASDTNGVADVFVRDRQGATTERLSVSTAGSQGNASSTISSISDDGRFVEFSSAATNLVASDTNGASDSFVRDRQGPTTERTSLTSSGGEANGSSLGALSGDGQHVVFQSTATNLVSGDTNGVTDVFVRDRAGNADLSVSVAESADPVSLGGDDLTYTVTVANGGPDDASGVSASVTMSGATHTIVSASASQGSCSVSAPTVSCTLGTIADAANATITVVVRPAATGTITATATTSGDQTDNNTGNNTDAESTTVDNALGCTIIGTNGNDTLTGTNGADVICGLGGNDTINGGNDNDTIYGGAGNDTIDGGNGDDIVHGGDGDDGIGGGNGSDTLYGEAGNDTNYGETLLGSLLYLFDNGADTIYGGSGNDSLDGQNGNDTLYDHDGTDSMSGGLGNDNIDVQDGVGGDTANGGLGSDTCTVDGGDTVSSC
jgi:hypothetical protein